MTGMAVLLLLFRSIVRCRERFAQSDEQVERRWTASGHSAKASRSNAGFLVYTLAQDAGDGQTVRLPPSATPIWRRRRPPLCVSAPASGTISIAQTRQGSDLSPEIAGDRAKFRVKTLIAGMPCADL